MRLFEIPRDAWSVARNDQIGYLGDLFNSLSPPNPTLKLLNLFAEKIEKIN
jgi:hypothetical protein